MSAAKILGAVAIIGSALVILASTMIGILGIAITRAGEDMKCWDRWNDNDDRSISSR